MSSTVADARHALHSDVTEPREAPYAGKPRLMHILIAGPIATADLAAAIGDVPHDLPAGYLGAPLTALLVCELLSRGHRVTALTTDHKFAPADKAPYRLERGALSVIVVPSRPRAWRFNGVKPGRILDFFAVERRMMVDEICRQKPDVVHAHWSYEFARAALDSNVQSLITCHDDPLAVLKFARDAYRMMRFVQSRSVLRESPNLTTVSPYLAAALAPRLKSDPEIIPNPVADLAASLGRTRERPTTRKIGMVSNSADRRKNLAIAYEAFNAFRRESPTAELHLFGKAFTLESEGHASHKLASVSDAVFIHGPLEHAEMLRRLSQVDLLLHPALEESFGVCVAEAMALGLAVVAGERSGAVPWVTEAAEAGMRSGAVLTDVSDAVRITQAIQSAFDEGYSARSRAARDACLRRFSLQHVADKYVDAYVRTAATSGVEE